MLIHSPAGGRVDCFSDSVLANNIAGNILGHGAIHLKKEHNGKTDLGGG